MPNIKFEYLYRDGGNYKQFGQIILENPSNLDPIFLTKKLREFLIDGEFFSPTKVGTPALEVYNFDPEIDHEWYEFETFSMTSETVDQEIDVLGFIERFK